MFIRKKNRHDDTPKTEVMHVKDTRILLEELPQYDTVRIAGMNEVTFLPQKVTDFYVDYGTATLWLHPDKKGSDLEVTYAATGSVLRAEDFNEIYDVLEKLLAASKATATVPEK